MKVTKAYPVVELIEEELKEAVIAYIAARRPDIDTSNPHITFQFGCDYRVETKVRFLD